jgi:hypothetical protein
MNLVLGPPARSMRRRALRALQRATDGPELRCRRASGELGASDVLIDRVSWPGKAKIVARPGIDHEPSRRVPASLCLVTPVCEPRGLRGCRRSWRSRARPRLPNPRRSRQSPARRDREVDMSPAPASGGTGSLGAAGGSRATAGSLSVGGGMASAAGAGTAADARAVPGIYPHGLCGTTAAGVPIARNATCTDADQQVCDESCGPGGSAYVTYTCTAGAYRGLQPALCRTHTL